MPRWRAWVNVPIVSRVVKRFNLQDSPIEALTDWLLNKWIQPVTIIDELLEEVLISQDVLDLDAASSTHMWKTVPADERWELLWVFKPTTTVATSVILYDAAGEAITLIPDTIAATTLQLGKDFKISAGWHIDTWNTDDIGDVARSFALWFIREKAFR